MYYVALISGVLCLAIWIYLLVAHGMFWKVTSLRADLQRAAKIDGTIAVVIPARDEADVIGATIQSLLLQTCRDSIHIFVVDDHSSDGTAEAARNCGQSASLDVITGT